jgi:hypothetical protein
MQLKNRRALWLGVDTNLSIAQVTDPGEGGTSQRGDFHFDDRRYPSGRRQLITSNLNYIFIFKCGSGLYLIEHLTGGNLHLHRFQQSRPSGTRFPAHRFR